MPDTARASCTTRSFPQVYDANIDILNLQVIEEPDYGVLKALQKHPLPDGMDFIAGVIDPKSTYVETPDEIAGRISRVLDVVPAERLGLTTGMWSQEPPAAHGLSEDPLACRRCATRPRAVGGLVPD